MKYVLASVLKSKDDIRLEHKIAQSIRTQVPEAQVEVWGQGNLYNFKRLAWARIWANLTFFMALWRARPDVLIVATFELLPASVLYKLLRAGKVHLGYDVQENYAHNIRYTKVFPYFLRFLLAWIVRLIERCALPLVDFVWVAEDCYTTEMPFLSLKASFLPNKVLPQVREQATEYSAEVGKVRVLCCGTISEDYGIFDAVDWTKAWQKTLPALTMHILGHCPKATDYQKLLKIAEENTFISLQISHAPLPYATILNAMQSADWLLMPYQINPSVKDRIPTKFYEALALGKRMLIRQNEAWQKFFQAFPEATVVWIVPQKTASEITHELQIKQQTLPARYIEGVFWNFEAEKLLPLKIKK